MFDMNQIVNGVVLEKVCGIKPDAESDDHKNITLVVKFDGIPLKAVFDKAVSGTVINWQNGPGRKKFEQWRNGQRVEITFNAPGRTTIDPEQAMIGKLTTMTPEEREEYIKEIMAKASN